MCGIVGYIGDQNASDILVDGLKKLEYQGDMTQPVWPGLYPGWDRSL